jgi:hypothetical protein
MGIVYKEIPLPLRVSVLEATIHLVPVPPEDVKARLAAVGRRATLVNTLLRPPEIIVRFDE